MIIDITNSNLINIKEGDMIYSIDKDEVSLVLEIKSVKDMFKGNCVHIFTNTELIYLGGCFETIDIGTYKIFREITIE